MSRTIALQGCSGATSAIATGGALRPRVMAALEQRLLVALTTERRQGDLLASGSVEAAVSQHWRGKGRAFVLDKRNKI